MEIKDRKKAAKVGTVEAKQSYIIKKQWYFYRSFEQSTSSHQRIKEIVSSTFIFSCFVELFP